MSRIARMPVCVPEGLEVFLGTGEIRMKGPKGELSMLVHSSVEVSKIHDSIVCSPRMVGENSFAQVGTARSLIANMVVGVTVGFEKELRLVGVGYRAQMQGNLLVMALGFSHSIEYLCPDDVDIDTPSQTRIVVRGTDKQRVGQVAAEIRAFRPPEPYKGKGVRYMDEFVQRKEAKKKQKQ